MNQKYSDESNIILIRRHGNNSIRRILQKSFSKLVKKQNRLRKQLKNLKINK